MTNGGMRPHPEALYYHIANDALLSAQGESVEFERKKLITVAMVFSALCLEAFVNQQHNWGSKRLSLINKWRQLPTILGAAQSFSESQEPFLTFVDLVTTRNNRLVHFKPVGETQYTGIKQNKRYFGDLVNDLDLAKRYVNCVRGMIEELNILTGGRTDGLSFLAGTKSLSDVWSSSTVSYDVEPSSSDQTD